MLWVKHTRQSYCRLERTVHSLCKGPEAGRRLAVLEEQLHHSKRGREEGAGHAGPCGPQGRSDLNLTLRMKSKTSPKLALFVVGWILFKSKYQRGEATYPGSHSGEAQHSNQTLAYTCDFCCFSSGRSRSSCKIITIRWVTRVPE
jgi:hypothetical protein